MGDYAWVTLATNDSYSLGALVLAHSLKSVKTAHKLVVLITSDVSKSMRQALGASFDVVQEVAKVDSKDEINLRLLKRPELGITFTKLHCWKLTQFEKCVFLDADILVLQNCDELFQREELSAAPDVGWPDCFNSGVFVFKPSLETHENLVQFAIEHGSYDGGDQGLLNMYFSNWSYSDINKHLPFIYNMCSTACYSYLPAFKHYAENAKIIHFIGPAKPWFQHFNTETNQVSTSNDFQYLTPFFQRWWDLFCAWIHPMLSPNMAPGSFDVMHVDPNNFLETLLQYSNSSCVVPIDDSILETEPQVFSNPWDKYEENTLDDSNSKTNLINNSNIKRTKNYDIPERSNSNVIDKIDGTIRHSLERVEIEKESIPNTYTQITISHPIDSPLPSQSQIVSTPPPISNSNISHTPTDEEHVDHGLAAAFSEMTILPPPPLTEEQKVQNELQRRNQWEIGNIDYLGQDSFDNIWKKISETLEETDAELTEDNRPSILTK